MTICVIGAGAFGTALAISFARNGSPVSLVTRDTEAATSLETSRENKTRLPGVPLPENLNCVAHPPSEAEAYLLAVPTPQLSAVVNRHAGTLKDKRLVACCKGISLETGVGPTSLLAPFTKSSSILTGPSFASDIARGLPTALTLACENSAEGKALQEELRAPNLRLYRTTDVIGAELGGALKNVIAIGCGAVMGAGLGVSARAALMTRGFAEMMRFSLDRGARAETLSGLSGLGDLTLTCTSDKSRNYRLGYALGSGETFDTDITVEGATTARALQKLSSARNFELPVTTAITALLDRDIDVRQAMDELLARPLKEE